MDYDFITTCNWTATGTYTLRAYLGAYTDVVTSYTLYYRKKGTTSWSSTTTGQVVISSIGEWEIANDWNKSGNDVLTHSYFGITAINKCTGVKFDETALGTTIGTAFLFLGWALCSSLVSMPVGFNLPTGITSVGDSFLHSCWNGCSSLTSMPVGFNSPTGITSVGDSFFNSAWNNCSSLTSMPLGFNIPTGITSVGDSFFLAGWYGCSSLASMPSGFNIPSVLTTVGTNFFLSCWYDCTLLSDDGYTEDLTFEFTSGVTVFGGTCPITTDSPIVGTKTIPVNVAVNRPSTITPNAVFFATNF